MTAAELRATGALTDAAADALARHIQGDPNLPERIAEDCRRADVSMVTMEDECYPLVLREIFDPPLVLYYRGTRLHGASASSVRVNSQAMGRLPRSSLRSISRRRESL